MDKKRKAVAYKIDGFPDEQIAGPYTDVEIETHRADIASFEGVYSVRVIDATIHILYAGAAICGFPDVPVRWPGNHVWTREVTEATCMRCVADHQTLNRRK